uniref:Uncharacterized protein n=1 Tax=Oryza brachyantha TaxID=4533 RepID=J3LBR5_ORYBR
MAMTPFYHFLVLGKCTRPFLVVEIYRTGKFYHCYHAHLYIVYTAQFELLLSSQHCLCMQLCSFTWNG